MVNCLDYSCGICTNCFAKEDAIRKASKMNVTFKTAGGASLQSLAYDLCKTKDETQSIGIGFVHDEVQVSVPKIYETVYVMALKELMANNMERLSSLTIQNEIVRIAESIAKLSADKFLQQREK